MSVDRLIDDWGLNWIAKDGTGRLKHKDHGGFNPKNPQSCNNGNGAMYACLGYLVLFRLKKLRAAHKREFLNMEVSLTRRHAGEPIYGLYTKQTGWTDSQDSLDNDCVMPTLAVIFDSLHIAQRVYKHGKKNWWAYNTENPGRWTWRSWRKPGDVYHYKICAGVTPNIIDTTFFIVGLLMNAFEGVNTSKHLMNWIRLIGIEQKLLKQRVLGKWRLKIHIWAKNFWLKRLLRKTDKWGIGLMVRQELGFDKNPMSPMILLSKNVLY